MRISDWSSDVCSSDLLARVVGSDAAIVILNGLDPESEAVCAAVGAIPVLNSLLQVARWRAHARALGRPLPAALQVASGMSRLGLPPGDDVALAEIGRASWRESVCKYV